MNRELITVIDQIGREKGIDKAGSIGAVEFSALQTAAKKRFGQGENIQVQMDTRTGEISVISLRTIVETVINPKAEVSLTEARRIDTGAEIGDEIGSLIEMDELGRIAAQTAKQVICQKVREAEWEAVLKEYSTRQGDLINGIIMGQEQRSIISSIWARPKLSCRPPSRFLGSPTGVAIVLRPTSSRFENSQRRPSHSFSHPSSVRGEAIRG